MLKIYPSSFALPQGDTTAAKYPKGCPVYNAFSMLDSTPQDFPEIYNIIGTLAEERQAAVLKAQNLKFEREVPVQYRLSPQAIISGRIDFITSDKVIYEVKATISQAKRRRVITQGHIDIENLGQLITYMSIVKTTHGVLSVSYLHFDKAIQQLEFETREFKVYMDQKGNIEIDKQPFMYTGTQLLQFYKIMMNAQLNNAMPKKTTDSNACFSCPFQKICEKNPKEKTEFVRLVNLEGIAPIPRTHNPKILCHNTKEKKV